MSMFFTWVDTEVVKKDIGENLLSRLKKLV
jgi:hypothetical protein